MGVVRRIVLSAEDREDLKRVVRAATSVVRMVERARIVLCASEGLKGEEIARRDRRAQRRAAPGAAADAWP